MSIDALQVIRDLREHHTDPDIIQLLDSIQTMIVKGKPTHGAHDFHCRVEVTDSYVVPNIIPKLNNSKTVVIVPRTKRNQNTPSVTENRLSGDCSVRIIAIL